MKYSGSCLCGSVTYECEATPVFQFNCHCRDCQRTTGAAYAPIIFFPKDSLHLSGELTFFESVGSSGKAIHRGFCKHCGAQMIGEPEVIPSLTSIRAGTLDDPTLYNPSADVFCSEAAAWDSMNRDIAKYDGMPNPKSS